MNAAWQTKKLGDVANVYGGGTPPTSQPEYFQGNINWYSPTEIPKYGVTILKESQRKISDSATKFTTISGTNSVLLTSRATIGTVGVLSTASGYSQGIKGIEPGPELDPWYLAHWLRSNKDEIINKASGTTFKEISTSEVKRLEIPLPPIAQQKKIVISIENILEKIGKVKENTEKNLQNSKDLFESYLRDVFSNPGKGWLEKSLGDVYEYDKTPNKNANLPYVGLEDIKSNTGKLIGTVAPKSVKSLTFHFSKEHVLYGRLRPYLNKVLMPNFEGHCSTEIFPIKPRKDILTRSFLFHWLISNETMNKINATWTGATLPRANMNSVLEFKINIPPISEQNMIVKKLENLSIEIKNIEAIYEQKLSDLEALKKSILSMAFSGDL